MSPEAIEACNGLDDNCDGRIDELRQMYYLDQDGDGYGRPDRPRYTCARPEGYSTSPEDCDDADTALAPDGVELCDGRDNDCDGLADEGLPLYYPDRDGDGFGDGAAPACTPGPGYITARGDCGDQAPGSHPGAPDAPQDGIDQDCGGSDGPDPHVGLPGSSFTSLQAALDAAPEGGTVWVGPGTWSENDLTFEGRAITLSSTEGAAATIVDVREAGRGFVFTSGEDRTTVLDGFTITHGLVASAGGGIYIRGSSPTLRACRIVENNLTNVGSGCLGGGIYLEDSEAVLEDCEIARNHLPYLSRGGGLHLLRSAAVITGARIQENGVYGEGGGLYLESSSALIEHSVLAQNELTATQSYNPKGAGAFVLSSQPVIREVGAMHAEYSSPVFTGVTVAANIARQGAGLSFTRSAATLDNCTLVDNLAEALQWRSGAEAYNTDGLAGYAGGVSSHDSGAAFSQVTLARNLAEGTCTFSAADAGLRCSPGEAGGLLASSIYEADRIQGSILAYNSPDNLAWYGKSLELTWSDLSAPSGTNHNLPELEASNRTVEPGFLQYDDQGLPLGLHLDRASPLRDAADPDLLDLDGSRADVGVYGGPEGDRLDRDLDGYPDWFWPGSIQEAPAGFDPAAFDADDDDPDKHQASGARQRTSRSRLPPSRVGI